MRLGEFGRRLAPGRAVVGTAADRVAARTGRIPKPEALAARPPHRRRPCNAGALEVHCETRRTLQLRRHHARLLSLPATGKRRPTAWPTARVDRPGDQPALWESYPQYAIGIVVGSSFLAVRRRWAGLLGGDAGADAGGARWRGKRETLLLPTPAFGAFGGRGRPTRCPSHSGKVLGRRVAQIAGDSTYLPDRVPGHGGLAKPF